MAPLETSADPSAPSPISKVVRDEPFAIVGQSGEVHRELTVEEEELLDAIKRQMPQLNAQEIEWMTPAVLAIYVDARSSLEERLKILVEVMLWRIDRRDLLSHLTCHRCAENPRAHDARCFGQDPDGDIVLMNCFALPQSFNPDDIAAHMVCVFERALRHYGSGRRWTWVIDMRGFGLKNLDPRTSIRLLHLLQVAYRGHLKHCLVLDAPLMFDSLWSLVKPWIKERTAAQICFDTWPNAQKDLTERVGADVASRMIKEIEENRDDGLVATKTWTTFWATDTTQG